MGLLSGKTIAVTRPRGQEESLVQLLMNSGARVVRCPLISIHPCYTSGRLHELLMRVDKFDWVCFTSVNGVNLVFQFAKQKGCLQNFERVKIACIGSSTHDSLKSWGFEANLVPEVYQAEGLVKSFEARGIRDKKFLLLRARGAREILRDALAAQGGEVTEIWIYEAIADFEGMNRLKDAILKEEIDCITFTSSSTVNSFKTILSDLDERKLLRGTLLASIGPITSDSLRVNGFTVGVEAEIFTTEGLAHAIEAFYRKKGAHAAGAPR